MSVGVVLVSHSPLIAEGLAQMVRQMAGDIALAFTGGDAGGGLGTDTEKIKTAIEEVWNEDGVAVFVDLGGAEMNTDVAIELLGAERAAKVRIAAAPIVEGAVIGATVAFTGGTLEEVIAEAEAYG
ncbi:MAG: PTS-dependent dihydroxyacetone kinase phosphotransferase subunit DhaM [Geminicoccaceae bacterium]|nr:PTS-dependent dihydroxyacetone kinase phosphotransferase subunit DhaM [Geminicoccaceae bacterium]